MKKKMDEHKKQNENLFKVKINENIVWSFYENRINNSELNFPLINSRLPANVTQLKIKKLKNGLKLSLNGNSQLVNLTKMS